MLVLEETFISLCRISRAIIYRFNSKTHAVTDAFVTFRPPCLCPSEGHKHGVSIQGSINLGDTLLQINREWKTAETWFLARLFIFQSSIVSKILEFIHWMVTILVLIAWLVLRAPVEIVLSKQLCVAVSKKIGSLSEPLLSFIFSSFAFLNCVLRMGEL